MIDSEMYEDRVQMHYLWTGFEGDKKQRGRVPYPNPFFCQGVSKTLGESQEVKVKIDLKPSFFLISIKLQISESPHR